MIVDSKYKESILLADRSLACRRAYVSRPRALSGKIDIACRELPGGRPPPACN